MQNGKFKWIIIGVIVIMVFSMQKEKQNIEDLQVISASKAAISVQSGFQKETKYVPTILFATNADYNCDDCSCSSSFTYCTLKPQYPSDDPGFDEWCNSDSRCGSGDEEPGNQCSSGYTYVGYGKCCPNNFPYYCSNNNLCYIESNCGLGTLGEVQCRAGTPSEGSILFRKEIVHSVANINSCIPGTIQGCGIRHSEITNEQQCRDRGYVWFLSTSPEQSSLINKCYKPQYGGTTDQDCLCDVYAWNANGLYNELNSQFFYDSPLCNSCSGNLCVRNNRCQIGEIRCADTTHYYACENIKPDYFANLFNDFTKTLYSCPGNTVCNVNKCEIPADCTGLESSAISLIQKWASNPINDNRNNAINAITRWVSSC